MNKTLFRLAIGRYTFAPSLLPSLAFLVVLPILVKLGFWQLGRADEKQVMLENLQAKAHLPAMTLQQALEQTEPDQTLVQVHGQSVESVFFVVDNQKRAGRLGFEVYGLWQAENGKDYYLVSRGWLPRKDFYQKVPAVPSFQQTELKGTLYFSKGGNKVVADNAHWQKEGNSWLIGQFDLQTIAEKAREIGYDTAPFVIRQQAQLDSPFVRQWDLMASPPEKHLAYAIQWFGMALVLIMLFMVLNLKRVQKNESASS